MVRTIHTVAAQRPARTIIWLLLTVFPISWAHASPFAYITNSFSNSVSVIDTESNVVTTTIPVGTAPLGVAVNKFGTRVYVANSGSNSVTVLDTGSNTVITTIPLGGNVITVAVSPDGTRVYAALQFANTVKVIDATNNTVIDTVAVPSPFALAFSPDGAMVYVTNDLYEGTVTVIDTASNTIAATVGVGTIPRGLAINSTGTRIYVANQLSNDVSVLDTVSNTVVATVSAGTSPYGVVVNSVDSKVYVTNNGSANVSVIDTATNTSLSGIVLPAGYPTGIAINTAGTRLYVAKSQPSGVVVIDTACSDALATLTVGENPVSLGLFIGPGGAPPGPPAPPLTTHVTGIEVTQAIQDVANSVPLILDRRTFVRVYVTADGPAVENVTASLTGLGYYMSGGSEVKVPLGSLVPSNQNGPRITVRPAPKRSNGNDSFLFELPWAWSNFAGLRLHATLSAPGDAAPASCASEVTAEPVHEFRTFTTLKVAFVQMAYQLPGLFTNPADGYAQTSSGEQRKSESWLRRAFPVSELLSFTPDLVLFDPLLGSFVDRSNPICQFLPADRKSLCAYTYVSALLAALSTVSSFMDGADVAYGLIPQHPLAPGTRGACCTGRAGAGPANDADYAAHEIGHFLGRQHPVEAAAECGHTATDPDYPYFFTFIAPPLSDPNTSLAGFDGGDDGLFLPKRFLPPASSFDIMGYCNPTTWISDYTYRALAISLEILHPDITAGGSPGRAQHTATSTLASAPVPGDWLLVFGQIAADLGSAAVLKIERVAQIFNTPPRPPGDFSIRLLDGVGATLADYSFAPDVDSDTTATGGAGNPMLSFGHAVPFVAGTKTIRIINTAAADAVLASAEVSANAPNVSNVVMQSGPHPETGAVTLSWSAGDADGDALHFDIFLARNGGATLELVQLGLSATTTEFDSSKFGGGSAQWRVVASDGLQTGFADSAPIQLVNRPPRPRILGPGNNMHVSQGQVVNLEADAFDPQDGALPDSGLVWTGPQGVIGTGGRASVATLPVGANLLTLTATNSLALTATRSVTVLVDTILNAPGPTLSAGPTQLGWQVAPNETQIQTTTLDIGNSGSGTLQFTVSSGASWLTSGVPSGTAPTTITLSADPNGFAAGTFADTTLTLTASGFPNQVIKVPVRLSVGNTFDIGNAEPLAVPEAVFFDGFEGAVPP